jgi:hypothetical protein
MKKSSLTKVLTILSSLILVTLFLLYRIGIFDESNASTGSNLQWSPNGGNINSTSTDSSKTKKDSTKPLMLSSSKVLILTDKEPSLLDSLKKQPAKPAYPRNEKEIFSSSKSVIVFKPKKDPKMDSLMRKYDSLKTKRKRRP